MFGDFPWVLRTPLPEFARFKDQARALVLAEFQAWTAPKEQYSFPVRSDDAVFSTLYDHFHAECERTFEPFTLHAQSKRQVFAYVQNNVRGASVWHDHLATSTINGVYYLSAPPASGQVWFLFREILLKTSPQEGWLYLFPRWLLHKPVPQQAPFHRISLNVEMITNECPIARDGEARW